MASHWTLERALCTKLLFQWLREFFKTLLRIWSLGTLFKIHLFIFTINKHKITLQKGSVITYSHVYQTAICMMKDRLISRNHKFGRCKVIERTMIILLFHSKPSFENLQNVAHPNKLLNGKCSTETRGTFYLCHSCILECRRVLHSEGPRSHVNTTGVFIRSWGSLWRKPKSHEAISRDSSRLLVFPQYRLTPQEGLTQRVPSETDVVGWG